VSDIKEVVLACCGGPDALVILNWRQDNYLEYLLVGRVIG
jgi:hypothetical protein